MTTERGPPKRMTALSRRALSGPTVTKHGHGHHAVRRVPWPWLVRYYSQAPNTIWEIDTAEIPQNLSRFSSMSSCQCISTTRKCSFLHPHRLQPGRSSASEDHILGPWILFQSKPSLQPCQPMMVGTPERPLSDLVLRVSSLILSFR